MANPEARFEAALKVVLDMEGGHSWDAGGGDTWFGIARRFHPTEPWPPSRERAIAIYRTEYWDHYRCGDLPWPLDAALFDGVVNQSAFEVIKALQYALHTEADGVVGSETVQAAERCDLWETAAVFFARRAQMYAQRSDAKYQIGLLARLFRVERHLLFVNKLVA